VVIWLNYDKIIPMLKDAISRKDSATIFDLAVKVLALAEQEGKIDKLLKDFPTLYEVVITFDRPYKK